MNYSEVQINLKNLLKEKRKEAQDKILRDAGFLTSDEENLFFEITKFNLRGEIEIVCSIFRIKYLTNINGFSYLNKNVEFGKTLNLANKKDISKEILNLSNEIEIGRKLLDSVFSNENFILELYIEIFKTDI